MRAQFGMEKVRNQPGQQPTYEKGVDYLSISTIKLHKPFGLYAAHINIVVGID